MSIHSNLKKIKNNINDKVTLVAVSKTKPLEDIKIAYDYGHKDFGENKVQELVKKAQDLPNDINWHMIGHLQRNKVKYIVSFIYLIHSVDSHKLLSEINRQASRIKKIINVLIQVDISEDGSKFGFSETNVINYLENFSIDDYQNIKIKGLMGMASFSYDEELIKKQFTLLNKIYQKFKNRFAFEYLSMGMSGDYKIALNCNSNMIRLGSNIFGKR